MSEAKKLQIVGTFSPKEVSADKIIFPEGLITTHAIGNVTLENGIGTLVSPGGSLEDFFNVFVDEKNPSITQPSVTATDVTYLPTYVEIGEYIAPKLKITFKPGSYSYDSDTGVVAKSCTVTTVGMYAVNQPTKQTIEQTSQNEFICSYDEYQVNSERSGCVVTVTIDYGDGIVPTTNLGNECPDGQIKAGSVTYRYNWYNTYRKDLFYGTLKDKSELTSDIIRGMTSMSRAIWQMTSGFDRTLSVPKGTMRVVVACDPDYADSINIYDSNAMGANITSAFRRESVTVSGANGYSPTKFTAMILDFANPVDVSNKFTVSIN